MAPGKVILTCGLPLRSTFVFRPVPTAPLEHVAWCARQSKLYGHQELGINIAGIHKCMPACGHGRRAAGESRLLSHI